MTQPERALSQEAWWLLCVSGIFALSVGLSNTFVNVYLWKVDSSFGAIGWFQLVNYAAMPVAAWLAGHVAKWWNMVWTLRAGIAIHAVFYAVALWGGTAAANRPWLLGAVLGLASGFYWLAFNVLSLLCTDSQTRPRFFGFNGVTGAVAGMIAPPVAGFLISYEDRLGGLTGYHVIFGLSFALFVLAALVSFRLHAGPTRGHLDMAAALRALARPRWRLLLSACAVYGLREGVFLFLIGLLFYISAGSELRLGAFAFLQSVLSSISFYLVSRRLAAANRLRVGFAGAVLMAAAAFLFLCPLSTWMIVVYGVSIALVLPLFLIPLQSLVFDAILHIEGAGRETEHFIIREGFANLGRVAGIALFLAAVTESTSPARVAALAVGLGFTQLGAWLLLWCGRIGDGSQARPVQAVSWVSSDARPRLRARGGRTK